jgi:hypothetical protein
MIPTPKNLIDTIKNPMYRIKFYANCVNYLQNLNINLKINIIDNNAYFLEPLRVHLTKNNNIKLFTYLSDTLPTQTSTFCYRELNLSSKAYTPLFTQLHAITQKSIKSLADDIQIPSVTPTYYIISETELSGLFPVEYNYSTINLLLGIKSLEILEYQNISRLSEFLTSTKPDIVKGLKPFLDFHTYYHTKLDFNERERMLIFSGCVLTVMGTIYTDDVDMIYIALGDTFQNINNFKNKIELNKDYDCHLMFKDKIEKTHKMKVREYLFSWFTRGWPNLGNAENMFDVVSNPNHHFHFMGMKFISLELTVARVIKRASASSYIDLMMLERFNSYTKTRMCFPNVSIQEGRISVFNDKLINIKLLKIKKFLKEWYNIEVTYDELKNKIYKCRDKPFEIYDTKPIRNYYTNEILKYHTQVMNYYIEKFFDKEAILDIGAGPLRQVEIYEQMGFKKLVALEPSKESIKTGYERFKEKCNKLKLVFVEGIGDTEWENDSNYFPILSNKPYKSILFKFTIHYMVKNFEKLFSNLKNVVDDDCTIIVSCLDGDILKEKFKTNGKYEIQQGDEPIYGAYDFPEEGVVSTDYQQIMIYFKGVYGVENGSIEYIVSIDYLISLFKKIGFYAVLNKNFMQITVPELYEGRKKYNNAQTKVSELHHILIFKNKK